MSQEATAAVVLAAGKSTRMKSELPKVMHEVCGRPMLAAVLDACRGAGVGRIVVVVGYNKQAVIGGFSDWADVTFVEQAEQKGTAHAVQMAEHALAGFNGTVLVIAGDMPLVRAETLRELVETRRREGAAAAIATTILNEPAGYGRIIRDGQGEFVGIVEDRDCTPDQKKICEVNPSYYCYERPALFSSLHDVRPNNAKGEYYITDTLDILRRSGRRVIAKTSVPAVDATGINSRADLADVSRMMQRRIQQRIMDSGVTIVSPDLTWIEADVEVGHESVIEPFSFVGASARIGQRCRIGPMGVVARGENIPDGRAVAGNLSLAGQMEAGPVERIARMAMVAQGRGA